MDTRSTLPNYDVDAVSVASGLACEPGSSMTQQQFKDECDINVLVARFGLTGTMPQNPVLPSYLDFTDVYDFQTSLNALNRARDLFGALPALVRSRFNHDPQQLLVFMADPANRAEAVQLGLVKAAEAAPEAPKA